MDAVSCRVAAKGFKAVAIGAENMGGRVSARKNLKRITESKRESIPLNRTGQPTRKAQGTEGVVVARKKGSPPGRPGHPTSAPKRRSRRL